MAWWTLGRASIFCPNILEIDSFTFVEMEWAKSSSVDCTRKDCLSEHNLVIVPINDEILLDGNVTVPALANACRPHSRNKSSFVKWSWERKNGSVSPSSVTTNAKKYDSPNESNYPPYQHKSDMSLKGKLVQKKSTSARRYQIWPFDGFIPSPMQIWFHLHM